ncbi:hypothetical protein [Glycomyces rhizosphaerae]|uniref:PH domain-containing protein n=1 Tax=Glycomyces rhizosphaerae TaxID=2054422 RepID=A0ABV7Q172_9ACTN
MTADKATRYRRVHFNPGPFVIVCSLMFLAVFFSTVFRDFDKPDVAPIMGWLLGTSAIVMNFQVILRIPAVETSEEGITLRPALGWGRVFVKWEDVKGVVIWHSQTGGKRSTMVAVDTREGFPYDNYGLYHPIHPTRNPPVGSKVKRRLRSWSVNTGKTSPRKIANLVNASGRSIPVVEKRPAGDTWNHSGTQ